ncbi:hypothetical protein QF035_011187 [Streptomyces umbrinus]|uniref:Uncharacterized protein n=1 Tax=Streptomyces umbrinus TaxID=67370 RepID=A0ABU0TCT9_9ACTN|nr:hypothetical protein [Streptomyces umbrinus]
MVGGCGRSPGRGRWVSCLYGSDARPLNCRHPPSRFRERRGLPRLPRAQRAHGRAMTGARVRRGSMAGDRFTQVANGLFRDAQLSFKAKGLFGLLSTHQHGWRVTVADLVLVYPSGRERWSNSGVSSVRWARRRSGGRRLVRLVAVVVLSVCVGPAPGVLRFAIWSRGKARPSARVFRRPADAVTLEEPRRLCDVPLPGGDGPVLVVMRSGGSRFWGTGLVGSGCVPAG